MSDRKNASSGATTQAPNNPPSQNTTGAEGKSIAVGGHCFTLFAACQDNEPRVRDIELARWLGYTYPGKIRELIKRLARRGLFDSDPIFITKKPSSSIGGRPAREFWLGWKQAMHVARCSETGASDQFMDMVFDVFDAARKQAQRATSEPVLLAPMAADRPRIGARADDLQLALLA